MSIYIFPKRGGPFTLDSWDTTKVANESYIFDYSGDWFHKKLDRLALVPKQEVPPVIRTQLLLVKS